MPTRRADRQTDRKSTVCTPVTQRSTLFPYTTLFRSLTNDTGCVWRHTYDPDSGAAHPFRSGYANAPCGPSDRSEEHRLHSSHTEIYTLSLHDALPISDERHGLRVAPHVRSRFRRRPPVPFRVCQRAVRTVRQIGRAPSALQSHRDLHSFPTRRSSDL